MSSRIITPAEWRAQPWKNGRGITHEVVRWPAGEGDYDVRVSVAEVSVSGAFSTFPGYQRWTVLLDDARIGLEIAGEIHRLVRGAVFEVGGDVPIIAHVVEPVHLFNVLARPNTIELGTGTAEHVDFAFAMSATQTLDRWHASTELASIEGEAIWLRSLGSAQPEDR